MSEDLTERFDGDIGKQLLAEMREMRARLEGLKEKFDRRERETRPLSESIEYLRTGLDDLRAGQAALRDEVHELRDELRGEMSALRDELRGEMSALRDELRGEMSALRDELRGEMNALREEVRTELQELRGEMKDQRRSFTFYTNNVNRDMQDIEERVAKLEGESADPS